MIGILLRHVLVTSERQNRKNQNEIRGALRKILGPSKEATMSSLLEEGTEIFREDTTRRNLLRLIERRFGPPDAAARARIDAADIPTLEAYMDRFVTATSVAEILDGEPAHNAS